MTRRASSSSSAEELAVSTPASQPPLLLPSPASTTDTASCLSRIDLYSIYYCWRLALLDDDFYPRYPSKETRSLFHSLCSLGLIAMHVRSPALFYIADNISRPILSGKSQFK